MGSLLDINVNTSPILSLESLETNGEFLSKRSNISNYTSLNSSASLDNSSNSKNTDLHIISSEQNETEYASNKQDTLHEAPSQIEYSKIKSLLPFDLPDVGDFDYSKTSYKTGYTNPIATLMAQETDWMPNMYNFYIFEIDSASYEKPGLVEMLYSIIEYPDLTTLVNPQTGRYFLNTVPTESYSIIATRIDGISIPQKLHSAQSYNVCGQTLSKPSMTLSYNNKVDLTVRLDQSMFILDAFHRLNFDWTASERQAREMYDPSKGYSASNSESGNLVSGKQFYLNFGNLPIRYINDEDNTVNRNIIDIIVQYDANYLRWTNKMGNDYIQERETSLSTTGNLLNDVKSAMSNVASSVKEAGKTITGQSTNRDYTDPTIDDTRYFKTSNRFQCFLLHDCRFLGRSGSLNFSNNKAEAMSATFPFVFRQCLRWNEDGVV